MLRNRQGKKKKRKIEEKMEEKEKAPATLPKPFASVTVVSK